MIFARWPAGVPAQPGRAASAVAMAPRVSSAVGRLFRRTLLGDRIRDTGCTLRVMRAAVAGTLDLQYRGLHRFIPELARQHGFSVIEQPVRHRPRRSGRTHYGVRNRALPGLIDLLAVRWMQRRRLT